MTLVVDEALLRDQSVYVVHSEISLLVMPLSFTGRHRKLKIPKIIAAGLSSSRYTVKKRVFSEMPLKNHSKNPGDLYFYIYYLKKYKETFSTIKNTLWNGKFPRFTWNH